MDKKDKKKKGVCPFLHDLVWVFAAPPAYLWFRPKKYYISEAAKKKIKGGALLISNHVGFYDAMYLMFAIGYRRHHFITTKELFSTKFKRFLFGQVFLCICLDRDSMGMTAVRAAVDELKRGGLVTMFPEGHINFDGTDVKAFKAGAALMALKSGRPIVPVYIHKRKSIWHRQITVVGEPISVSLQETEKPVMEYLDDVTRLLREKEAELESLYRSIMNKKKERSKQ